MAMPGRWENDASRVDAARRSLQTVVVVILVGAPLLVPVRAPARLAHCGPSTAVRVDENTPRGRSWAAQRDGKATRTGRRVFVREGDSAPP